MAETAKGYPTLAWLIFLIWPLGAIFYAFNKYKHSWGKNIVWAFVAFYGYIFQIPPESNIDAGAYKDALESLYGSNISFMEVLQAPFTGQFIGERPSVDFFQPVLTFLVSRFTDNYHVMFLLVGVVFGFFFSRNLWMLFEKCEGSLRLGLGVLILLLIFIIPPWLLQSIRFYTAANIFIYGVFRYYLKNDKRGLWIAALSVLVHFSFIFAVLLLLLKRFIIRKNNYKFLFWLFLITIPLSILSMDAFSNFASRVLPDIFQFKIEAYTSERAVMKVSESDAARSIFTIVYDYFRPFIMVLMLVILYSKRKEMKIYLSGLQYNFLCFITFFAIVMNLIGFVPSMDRFYSVVFFIMVGFFIVFYQKGVIKISKQWMVLLAPLAVLYVIGTIRYGVGHELTGISYVFKSPVYVFFQSIL